MSESSSRTGVATEPIPGHPIVKEPRPAPCTLVIFGAAGDLARRKLVPALFNLAIDGMLPDPFAVVGVSRADLSAEELRARFRESLDRFARRRPLDVATWERFAPSIEYLAGKFEEGRTYAALGERLAALDRDRGTGGNRVYYFATPATFFPVILEKLHGAGLLTATADPGGRPYRRVVIEKPFGRDLLTAEELNRLVASYLDESQVFRIDHYLGKETVQNILVLRFGNSIFEPIWNRKYVDHVQITASESIGVEGRGGFYDATGVLRDIVQNHLLQVLSLFAMEPPASFAPDDVRDRKVDVLRSLRPIGRANVSGQVVRGQYAGYRQEDGVAPNSRTPTYVAMRVMIDNWRWQGVPFYLRAGKTLAERRTEVAIQFQPIPLCLFAQTDGCQVLAPNTLVLNLQPHEGVSLRFVAKVPGDHLHVGNVSMNMSYATAFGKPITEAYERLLLDIMRGDATLFGRRDGVEAAWRFCTPILQAWEAEDEPVPTYEQGSEGPAEARDLVSRDGREWRELRSGYDE